MKILTERVATSALAAIALLCIGALIGALPASLHGSGADSGGVAGKLARVLFFPCWLLGSDTGLWPDVVTLLLGLLGLALTLAVWTGVIHGLRLLLARR